MPRTNDFAFKIATANGTGSASANGLIMQAIFRMGVPVTGKNVFPSNIQGLPTWYEIRVSRHGYTARTPHFDLMVAMNPATYQKDVADVRSGGWLMYDSTWPLDQRLSRPDVTYLGIPLAEMCNAQFNGVRERILMKNVAYAGALAALLDMDAGIIRALLNEKFSKKPALMDSNQKAVDLGYDYAKTHFECPLPIRLESMDATTDSILIDGNTAAALGCLYAGATVGAWYPITPATSLMEAFKGFCQKYRRDPDSNRNRFAILQAEDELAAIGMVIGASWAGARAFTPTAGPGISLMTELIGLAYYAEVPAVIFDVQRVGPSTGLPTRTAQGDLMQAAFLSHGDTKHVMIMPSTVAECYSMAQEAFELAEQLQTPIFVMMDLDLGMNHWMSEGFAYPEKPINRGKLLTPDVLQRMGEWGRYKDIDGDGIPYRTIPGDGMPVYFTRGSGHNAKGQYSERPDDYVENMDRLARKFETARTYVPKPVVDSNPKAKIGFIGYGTTHFALEESRDQLREETSVETSYFRLRGYPFNEALDAFIDAHERVYVIEQNRDAQLRQLMQLELLPERQIKLRSVLHYNGLPIDARSITDDVLAQEGFEVARKTVRTAGSSAGMTGGE